MIPARLLKTLALTLCLTAVNPFIRASQYYNDWTSNHLADIPAQAGPSDDPDGDSEPNLVEFAFGTDPRGGRGIAGAVDPIFGSSSGTNGIFSVNILELAGHQPGAQIDLYLSSNVSA